MRITVIGLSHLGCTFAACLSRQHDVTALEIRSSENLDKLRNGEMPLNEPGLADLFAARRAAGRLHLGYSIESICSIGTDVLWVCHDVDVAEDGTPDASRCLADLDQCLRYLPKGKLVILTSQLPVGTCAALQKKHPAHRFAVIPENLRIGRAIESFDNPKRTVVGVRPDDAVTIEEVGSIVYFWPSDILRMSPESAEMTKHALNAFLALQIAFINEVATLCKGVGADAQDVSKGLLSEARISPKAYLKPGAPFSGWTLVRDLTTLENLGATTLIAAIKQSNRNHALRTRAELKYSS